MKTELYWIDGPWPGRLAIMPRPRGGDWLADEVQSWRRAGIDLIVSLLEPEEVSELDLEGERELSGANDVQFLSFPIPDRGVPALMRTFAEMITELAEQLQSGKNVAVHCRQGIGRAALVAIGLLIHSGVDSATAAKQVGLRRGRPVPETEVQMKWIVDFAKSAKKQPASALD